MFIFVPHDTSNECFSQEFACDDNSSVIGLAPQYEETVEDAMEKFAHLVEVCFKTDDFDADVVNGVFRSVYDERVILTVPITDGDGRASKATQTYEDIYEAYVQIAQLEMRPTHFEMERVNDHSFRYVGAGTNGAVTVALTTVVTVENGKIVRAEREEVATLQDKPLEYLRALFVTFSGQPGEVPVNVRQLVTNVFDKSLAVSTESGVLHFDDFYQHLLDLYDDGVRLDLVEARRVEAGLVHLTLRLQSRSFDYTIRAIACMTKGKIVTIQPLLNCHYFGKCFRANVTPVSGQLAACFFPKFSDLTTTVHALPEQVEGLLLCDAIEPVRQERQLLRLHLQRSNKIVSRTAVDVATEHGERYSGGVVLTRLPFRNHRWVVRRCKTAVACIAAGKSGNYLVLGVNPIIEDDEPVLKHDGIVFYPWYQVAGDSPGQVRVQVWDGTDYEALWCVKKDGVVFNKYTSSAKDAVVVDEGNHFAVAVMESTEDRTVLTIAPGIDPSVPICLSVIVDEIGKTRK